MKRIAPYFIILLICFMGCRDSEHSKKEVQNETNSHELKSITIEGDTLHYLDVGKGDPVVFIHGSIGDYRAWETQIDTFASSYRVIAYSRRYAWPNSQRLADSLDYSAGKHADDLAQLITTLDLGPSHLVGHSWGGYTALKTAIDNPDLVKSLVLGEPPATVLIMGDPEGDSLVARFNEQSLAPAAKSFAENKPEDGVRFFVNGVMGDSTYYNLMPQDIRDIWLQNTTEIEGLLRTDSITAINGEEVAQMEMPILMVYGEDSPKFFKKIVDTIHSLLPNIKVSSLSDTSHGLQLENPEEFNNVVLGFLAAQE
ncbi:alpha/beta hydrolase [Salegentibacter sp. JZCK2]|uniref:alpha/beta fold hydrolase n=1 Tax=Salegentibacter tibetensis TaxID=2873600 RepID=UPI001CCEE59A|nr:alpha/beta hydrolase [Salegentibacter tibetensis]MBZ9729561.1 alpha/beta hydrolase [Salegentibacter tibetensis]